MRASHRTDGARVARLRAPWTHRAGTVRQGLATLRIEGAPASQRYRNPQDVWHDAGADPLTPEEETDEATRLVESKVGPSSAPAMALANRLAQICSDHSLGDPLVYARWAGAMQFRSSADENARKKSAWAYLASALQAHGRPAH